jgi:hypothetical protein
MNKTGRTLKLANDVMRSFGDPLVDLGDPVAKEKGENKRDGQGQLGDQAESLYHLERSRAGTKQASRTHVGCPYSLFQLPFNSTAPSVLSSTQQRTVPHPCVSGPLK